MSKRVRTLTLVSGFLILGALALAAAPIAQRSTGFDFEFVSISGEPLPMSQFSGRPVLVVNTASMCGFTPQYEGLQTLWERYRDRGFVLVGVPSNDFGGQEPGTEKEIKKFCEVNFNIDFPLTAKQRVTGDVAHPLFKWFVEEKGAAVTPQWNFHKYLIAPDGSLAASWPSRVTPLSEELTSAVEAVLTH